MNRTDEILNRVDKYINMVRYQYLSEEKLSRLTILSDYYDSFGTEASEEVLSCGIESAEQLSGKFKLPLKVRGVFLTEGRPRKKFYSAEELEKSTKNPVNKSFPLMLDHRDKEASYVIGMVDKIWFDPKIKGLRWKGHINDETCARNVVDAAIKQVSATIFSVPEQDVVLGVVGLNLTYKELSLVMDGAEPHNSIMVDK